MRVLATQWVHIIMYVQMPCFDLCTYFGPFLVGPKVYRIEVSAHRNDKFVDLKIGNLQPASYFSVTLNQSAVC